VSSHPLTVSFSIRFFRARPPATGNRPRFAIGCLVLLTMLALAPGVVAQPTGQRGMPRIGYLYPAGGQQGTTFTVAIGGQSLNGASAVYISGSGVKARVIGYDRPLTQKEFNDAREKIQQLQDKRAGTQKSASGGTGASAKSGWTADDEKTLAELRVMIAKRQNRQVNPALAETVTLEVTLAPDATPGEREVRLKTPTGLSNPMVCCVGQLPEFSEPAVSATNQPAPAGPNRKAGPPNRRTRPPMAITLPATVNGQVLPGETDRFQFSARQGQRLTVAASARALIPYLADAVPGWFQATLALYDGQGREVAYDDDFRFNPDPVLSYAIPADGNYTIEIKDSIYRGREDFVYRIAIGELPFVTSVFPLGSAFQERANFEIAGWNLPIESLAVDTKNRAPGTFLLSVRNQGVLSNSVRFALDAQPDCRETEPNETPAAAQPLELPMIVNGRIDRAGDEDVFRFTGRRGTEFIAEIFARRLNSPLDSVLKLTDAAGRQLAFNDDHEDKGAGLTTHHADSRLSVTLPEDGTYYLRVTDAQHRGGAEFGYRLRVGPPRPDFDLRVVPSTINARAGTHVPITVYALRRDGFEGEIMLGLRDAPRGFALSGARIPAHQEKVQLTLAVPSMPQDEPIELAVVGLATIQARTVAHTATPAEDMMQAFFYRHLVTSKQLMVQVSGRGGNCRVLTRGPVRIPAGGTARIEITTPSARGVGKVQLALADPPEGITVQSSSVRGDVVAIVLACDAAKAKPGLQGNLILTAVGERTGAKQPKKQATAQRVPLGSVPAIAFEVVAARGPST
jgi:hypothetical protein